MRRRVCATWLLALPLAACAGPRSSSREPEAEPPAFARLGEEDIARLIPASVEDRRGWARDILHTLTELDQGSAPPTVCSVLAIVEQESGYHANPVVPGLADVVQKRLNAYADKLGPVGRPALRSLLDGKAPGQKLSFDERLKRVRTEKDLDIIFRELLAYYEERFPRTFLVLNVLGGVFTRTHLEDLNPITTAGSMQVSVRFATELGAREGKDATSVRDALYTRPGGVYYGTARLLGYTAAYPDPVYRFADYNSGIYGSRNAALQAQVAELTGVKLDRDGDLLAYNRAGQATDAVTRSLKAVLAWRARYAPGLGEGQVRRDLHLEKQAELEGTETWRTFKRSYEKVTGKSPAYAQMPEVVIRSPKMSKERSTGWYAKNVNVRYQACMKRVKGSRPSV